MRWGLRIVTPKAMQTNQSDKEFDGSAGRKRSKAVDLQVVKLPEQVDKQGTDRKKVTRFASLLDLIQAWERRQHKDVVVKAMIAHQQFQHHENSQDGKRSSR
jgi:hypothetical protein